MIKGVTCCVINYKLKNNKKVHLFYAYSAVILAAVKNCLDKQS